MQINNVVIAGRLVDDVKYQSTKNGTPLATFKIANNRGNITNYFRIASFGKIADYAKKYLTKSQRLTIQGVLNHHEKHDRDGWHDYYTIIADTFDAIHRKSRGQSKTDKNLYAKIGNLNKRLDEVSSKVSEQHGHRKTKTKRKVITK